MRMRISCKLLILFVRKLTKAYKVNRIAIKVYQRIAHCHYIIIIIVNLYSAVERPNLMLGVGWGGEVLGDNSMNPYPLLGR